MMTKLELKRYKSSLLAKEIELGSGLRKRNTIAIEQVPDAMDATLLALERDFAIQYLDREATLLKEVRGALARIDDGSYGHCLGCEEEINLKRLTALPWAGYCLTCQQIVDNRLVELQQGLDMAHAA